MKTQTHLDYSTLPRDYTGLCGILTPRPIRDRANHENTSEIVNAMALHAASFSADQADYFDVLVTLLESYDDAEEKNAAPRGRTPLQRLQYLAGESGMSGADVAELLGVTRRAGAMILSGERAITAEHARALGAHFAMPAGFFIE